MFRARGQCKSRTTQLISAGCRLWKTKNEALFAQEAPAAIAKVARGKNLRRNQKWQGNHPSNSLGEPVSLWRQACSRRHPILQQNSRTLGTSPYFCGRQPEGCLRLRVPAAPKSGRPRACRASPATECRARIGAESAVCGRIKNRSGGLPYQSSLSATESFYCLKTEPPCIKSKPILSNYPN